MPRPSSPHPPPPGRRARRKIEMRARILSAAFDLFAQQGFFDTTVEQITEAADVGKGTFFNYFPSKEHVLAGFGEMQVARIEHGLTEARRGIAIQEVLRRLAHSLTEEPGRSQALVRSLMTANLSSEPVRNLFRHNLARGRRGVARILTVGQQRGEIRRDLRPATHARIFQQLILGTILLWTIHPPSSLDRWVDPSFEVFWRAIAVPKGGKR